MARRRPDAEDPAMTAALIGSAVALTAYALGYWTGRRTAECHELHWVPAPPTDDPDCPIGHIMLASGGRRIDLAVMHVAIDATRQRDRYRLAWLSARRRARDGRQYARVLNHALIATYGDCDCECHVNDGTATYQPGGPHA
jgi:hypothetical protein